MPLNATEEFVYQLCSKSFLSLWSYANPRKKPNGKELCDVLVVSGPDIIIFSVKHVNLRKEGSREVNLERWKRRAIEESVSQVYGAERILKGLTHVVKNDSTLGVPLPQPEEIRIHRIAVALGSDGTMGMPYGDFGKGFVHVLDESATEVLLSELDTISDFVEYLRDKEQFLRAAKLECEGSEEDLLAGYLQHGKQFWPNYDVVMIKSGTWKAFQALPEYTNKKTADKESYAWDKVIEVFCRDILNDDLEFSSGLSESERSVRAMALEDRFSRRVVGKSWLDFLDKSHDVRSRITHSPSGMVYVFLATPHGYTRKDRQAELGNRCFVARGKSSPKEKVIGLATEQYTPGKKGFSFDLIHLYKPDWSDKDQELMDKMQAELGYFVDPRMTNTEEDEYPAQAKGAISS
jgi:hypothetical protein